MDFILTLSCPDKIGIVAAVTGCLANIGAFISESAQFGDFSTRQFFMRSVFTIDKKQEDIENAFRPIAEKFEMDYALFSKSYKPKVLIMVSKLSHCLNDLLHRYSSHLLPIEIPVIVSNHEDLKGMAENHKIPFMHLPISEKNKKTQENELLNLIDKHQIDLVVLARYMQILSAALCKNLEGKAINIHHSFLPSFKGAKPYHQAFDRGVKLIGATAHYVTENLDEGPIIEQEVIRVNHTHAPSALMALGQDIECLVLAKAVKFHIERRVLIDNKKTIVFN